MGKEGGKKKGGSRRLHKDTVMFLPTIVTLLFMFRRMCHLAHAWRVNVALTKYRR